MKKIMVILFASLLILTSCQSQTTPQEAAPAQSQPTVAAVQEVPTSPPIEVPTDMMTSPTDAPPPAPTATNTPLETLAPILQATPRYAEPLKVITEKDIPFTKPIQANVLEQQLDIYHPDGAGPWPVVVIVPPVSPYRNTLTSLSLGKAIAGQGAVVVLPDIGPVENSYFFTVAADNNGKLFRQIEEEISCALSFARAKTGQYGGNPDNIIVFGLTVGAVYGMDVLLQGAGLESTWDAFSAKRGGPPAQTQCVVPSEPVKVDALVSYNGAFYMEDVKKKDPEVAGLMDPLANAGGSPDVKLTLMYRKNDPDNPLEATTKLMDALSAAGHQVELLIVNPPGASISSKGPELGWITNALLQYAKK